MVICLDMFLLTHIIFQWGARPKYVEEYNCLNVILHKLCFNLGLKMCFCLTLPAAGTLVWSHTRFLLLYFHYHNLSVSFLVPKPQSSISNPAKRGSTFPVFGCESGSSKGRRVQSSRSFGLFFFLLHLFGCCFHFQNPLRPHSAPFLFGLRVNPEQAVWLKGETDLREMSRGRWRSKQNRIGGRFQEQQAWIQNPGRSWKQDLEKARTHVLRDADILWGKWVILK